MILLTTTGRRSGNARTTPVMYIRDGERFIVSSENFGQERVAAWPLEPARRSQRDGADRRETLTCRARLLDDEEADRYWPRLVEVWPAHETYRVAQR